MHICTLAKKTVEWQGLNFSKGTITTLRMLKSLYKMPKDYKHVYALGIIASFCCVLLRKKYNAIILALYDFTKPNMITNILNRAEKVFVEGNKGEIEMYRLGVSLDKIVKFQHWCDQFRFAYKEKKNFNMKVLFIGRPIKIKGRHIIEECQKLTEGIDYEYIENAPYEDLASHYQMADVVVVPSLYSEGFSRVVIEAASCGCAVISSNRGALPEMVSPFGKCIEPTPENFATELNKLKFNRTALEKLQRNTAIYALKHFNEKNANCFYSL